jgi:RND family efflux transporter MFP subunit
MKMIVVFLIIVIGIFTNCNNVSKDTSAHKDSTATAGHGKGKILYWYDPMNPSIHYNHPGKSPMGMDLVPRYANEQESNPNVISVDPAMVQNIGVVTAAVERRKLMRAVHSFGVVIPDEKNVNDINTRVDGWISRLYFNYTGIHVRKGQSMARIYSPQLISAQEEFLQSIQFATIAVSADTLSKKQPETLIKSARDRLAFFGMDSRQIDTLQSTGKVMDHVLIRSSADGVILEKMVFEGQKISAGQTLFRVADLRRVWILADVFKIDMPFIQTGAAATVTYGDNESFCGNVDFVYPAIDPTVRSFKVRIPINNPDLTLKVEQYVNVTINSLISYSSIAVPSQAVIFAGLRNVVAVSLGGGRFEIRDVKIGAYADGYYEITDGLQLDDTIVTSGQFLIDSDANLKSAGGAMAGMPGMNTPSGSKAPQPGNKGMENMPGMEKEKPAPKSK